jgi:hypothetical protein
MKQAKLIISTVVVLMAAMPGANAVVCMKEEHMAPDSCLSHSPTSSTSGSMTWTVSECTGGSGITSVGGEMRCSDTNDGKSQYEPGNPGIATSGSYCWCRLTSPAASASVFRHYYGSLGNCARGCASVCAESAHIDPFFRSALFDTIGQ